jgi:putative transposase
MEFNVPRPKRLNLPGIPQHVTQRGNNRQACFFTASDYRLYLDLLAKSCQKHDCLVHAFVLMTNHVHLLITPQREWGVSRVMQGLARDYVRTINKLYRRTGTMWEGRFKSSLVDQDQYCLSCYRYIELNPVRAGMVSQPSDYPWSSFGANALGQPLELLTPHPVWLGLGANDTSRRSTYLDLFHKAMEEQEIEAIRYGIKKGLPTGSDRFKHQIETALKVRLGDGKQGRPTK